MKKVVFTLALMFVASLVTNSSVAQEVTTGPKIEFTKDVHDYGDIAYGSDGSCTFVFKNTGNAPLTISNAKGSCGCTVPEWPKEAILPGQTGEITVKYDTKRPGAINKSVTITSNAIDEPSKVIRIKGSVGPNPETGVSVDPSGAPINK